MKKHLGFMLTGLLLFCSAKEEFVVTSPAFPASSPIPSRYTCEGEDISPPLHLEGVPKGTKSLAIVCDDPDAPVGTWVHWVIYNLPPETRVLEEGVPKKLELEGGGVQGMNDFSKVGYGGPCPPKGKPHRYFLKVYALDEILEIAPGAKKSSLLTKVKGHVLAQAELMGTFQR